MWLVGNTNNGVPPLKTLAAADVAFMGERSRKTLSEMRGLAQAVEKAGKITGAWKSGNFRWSLQSVTELFQNVSKCRTSGMVG